MTPPPVPPTPEQAAEQLGVIRYAITAPTAETHSRLALEAPYANWAEMLPKTRSMVGVTFLVTVFAVDNDAFLTVIAGDESVTAQAVGEPQAEGFWPPLDTVAGHSGRGWRPWTADLTSPSGNGHGR